MSPSANVRQPAEHRVFIRTGNPVNGETTGWKLDENLRCQSIAHRAGPNPGDARFAFVRLDNKPVAIEDVLNNYHPDTQVRVELFPYDSPQGADTGTDGTGLIVFEGVLERQTCQVQSRGTRSNERAGFVALALPWIDGRAVVHQVTGRWMWFLALPLDVWDRVESPLVPASFNYRGRANMDADDTHKKSAAGLAGGVLTAHPFTHDDDPDGVLWTVRHALRSLLVQWLYGEDVNPRDRVTGVESDTLIALEADAVTDDRFKGLDDVLPETDVSGMRLFEAIDAVCKASGFQFAVGPNMAAADGDTGDSGGSDRRYSLRLWRRHTGPAVDLMLPKRGAFPSNGAETLRRANMNKITILRDNAGIVNHVFARGRVLIEAGVELKPLWKLSDVTLTMTTATHVLPIGSGPDDQYHRRHVQGGADFAQYGHVGREWGIDCTGARSINGDFYITGYYQHPPSGFDWLALLGVDGTDPLTAERTARNIDEATDPIVWTTRLRRVLPLRRADTQNTGKRFVLEASEDSGATWLDVTSGVSFTTLRDFFGIRLTGLGNLATVSNDTLGTGTQPAFDDSWWAKIIGGAMRLRLTCLVEADHAALHRADRQSTSGTGYLRGELIDLDIEEVWSHTDSVLNTSGSWEKISATPGSVADASAAIKGAAERHRDAREGTRYAVGCDTFILEPGRWQVGNRVRGVSGRGISFATNAGAEERHPSIHEVRMVLSGPKGQGAAQGVFLSLTDTAQRGGI